MRANHERWIELAEVEIVRALAELKTGDAIPTSVSRSVIAAYVDMLWGPRGPWVAEWLVANLPDDLIWKEPFFRRIEMFPEGARLDLTKRLLVTGGRLRSEAIRVLLGSGSGPVADPFVGAYLAAWANQQTTATERRRDELFYDLRDHGPLLVDAILLRSEASNDFGELKQLY